MPVALLAGLSKTTWGSVPLPLALDAFGFPACSPPTSVDVFLPAVTGTAGKDRGFTFVDVPLPLADSSRTLTLHGQWLVPRPTGGGLSAALSWGG